MSKLVFDKPYDDPYRVLACHLAGTLSVHSLNRLMHDNSFVKSLLMGEMKHLDISGPFLDCLDQEVITNDKVREKNKHLRDLGEFYFKYMDIPRLRIEVRRFVQDECGVELE